MIEKNKYAVIDLGTNTFHILIASITDRGIQQLYRKRFFIYLSEEGIEVIGNDAIKRALSALNHFREKLDEFHIENYQAIGTAAMRTAKNGPALIEQIKEETNIDVNNISGYREAELIFKGVREAVDLKEGNHLIMDIGGGSVEFILTKDNELKWAESFPIGIGVLYRAFHKEDPITASEQTEIYNFIKNKLEPLILQLQGQNIKSLIGASGSFEVLESMIRNGQRFEKNTQLGIDSFHEIYTQIISQPLEERLKLPGLPKTRAKLIVVAMELMKHVISISNPKTITVSAYALKEGLMTEMHDI